MGYYFSSTWILHPLPIDFLRNRNQRITKSGLNFSTPVNPQIPLLNHLPDSLLMALASRSVFCQLQADKPAVQRPAETQKLKLAADVTQTSPAPDNGKIVLQPRLCTLRSYGVDRVGVMKAKTGEEDEVSPFFATLTEYIESSKKSQDFEIITGRLAMIVFAATVGMEMVTGNSVFRKMDLQGIEEAAGVCLAAVTSAAIIAWFSSMRKGVGRMFTVRCNALIDSIIDQIVDGLFYEIDPSDWSDEL